MARSRHKPGGLALLLLVIACSLFPTTHAHTFVERLMRIHFNGSMVGPPGFMRGMEDRAMKGWDDTQQTYRITPPIQDFLIAPPYQRTANYSAQFPPLTASPGDLIALQYQENGHVTLPGNPPPPPRPKNRGTVYIYGTAEPLAADTKLLDIHYKWNQDGTGGNGKGKLIATRNYDDGRCYQVNTFDISHTRQEKFKKASGGPMGGDVWCQNDLALPEDLEVGSTYTLIWVWDWPLMDREGIPVSPVSPPVDAVLKTPDGFEIRSPELYPIIMDINIVDPCDKVLGEDTKGPLCQTPGKSTKTTYQMLETDLNKAAIAEQLTNNFLVPVPDVFNSNKPGSPVKGPAAAPVPAASEKPSSTVKPSVSSSASAQPSSKASTTGSTTSRTAPPKDVVFVTFTVPAQTYTYTTTVSPGATSKKPANKPTATKSGSDDAPSTADSSASSDDTPSTVDSSSTSCTCSTTTSTETADATTTVSQGAKIPLGTAPTVTGFDARDEAGLKDKRALTWTG